MGILDGRRGLILGIANERSLAYGIAKAAVGQGAQLALTYQNERLQERVTQLAKAWGGPALMCDVASDAAIAAMAQSLSDVWSHLDFVVHAIASAKRDELMGRFVDTSRDGFAMALDISVYSLVGVAKAVLPLLEKGTAPSILTLSYIAAEKAVPNYNVMGVAKAALEASVRYLAQDLGPQQIRVNAISAGPVKTLSSAGIGGLRQMLSHVEAAAPLRRNIGIDDVGDAATFVLSPLARGITGEIMHVDAGYHALGAPGVGSATAPS